MLEARCDSGELPLRLPESNLQQPAVLRADASGSECWAREPSYSASAQTISKWQPRVGYYSAAGNFAFLSLILIPEDFINFFPLF